MRPSFSLKRKEMLVCKSIVAEMSGCMSLTEV